MKINYLIVINRFINILKKIDLGVIKIKFIKQNFKISMMLINETFTELKLYINYIL